MAEQSALLHQLHADLTAGLQQVTAGLQQVNARIDQVNDKVDQRTDQVNARIDKLLLATLAIGGGLLAGLVGIIAALVVQG